MTSATTDLICRVEGGLGHITLNRPASLNALTRPMIDGMYRTLRGWLKNRHVERVLIDGSGDRAFSAGGDIAIVYLSALADGSAGRKLWQHEYALDRYVANYPKPMIAILNGMVLGGGVGIGAHRKYRVVTERTQLAMPEVAIGLAPDVGGLFLLAKLPGELGTHLALTGFRLNGEQLIAYGLADSYVLSADVPDLVDSLSAIEIETSLERFKTGTIQPSRVPFVLNDCYESNDVATILERLRSRKSDEAVAAAGAIERGCPMALKVTLAAFRRAQRMSTLEECLRQDLMLSKQFLARSDIIEGIRAAIIEKDRNPTWSPPNLSDVDESTVESFFLAERPSFD